MGPLKGIDSLIHRFEKCSENIKKLPDSKTKKNEDAKRIDFIIKKTINKLLRSILPLETISLSGREIKDLPLLVKKVSKLNDDVEGKNSKAISRTFLNTIKALQWQAFRLVEKTMKEELKSLQTIMEIFAKLIEANKPISKKIENILLESRNHLVMLKETLSILEHEGVNEELCRSMTSELNKNIGDIDEMWVKIQRT